MGERAALLARIAGLIGAGVARVAVDGVDGVGKSTFAAALTAALRAGGRPVVHVSADDFHQLRALRHRRGRDSPEGLFLHRDELAGCFDLSIFLTAPFAVTVARMARRDGSHPDPGHPSVARYVQGQRLYFAACRPWERADLVIDNTDVEHPVLLSPFAGPA